MDTLALRAAPPRLKRDRLLYGVTTGIIVLLMSSSALYFAFGPNHEAAFHHLGLPSWFRAELTIAKLLGVAALVVPSTPTIVRQFAYFGFGLTIVSADVAHLSSGDPVYYVVPHLFFLGCLATSYVLWQRLRGAAPEPRA